MSTPMAETTSAPSLRELSEASTQGEWHHRQAGKANSGGPLDWIGDAPDGSAHTKIIVGRQCLYGGSDDYAFVARLVSDYRAGRLIDPTTQSEAVASARAEGRRDGLEEVAKHFADAASLAESKQHAARTGAEADDFRLTKLALIGAEMGVRALIPAPPTTPGGRTDG